MKIQKRILKVLIIVTIIYVMSMLSSNVFGLVTKENTKAYFLSKISRGFGQADCILLENVDSKGKKTFALIDTGRIETSEYMVNYLKNKGVQKLEFVILTHNHGDHTGGMYNLLDSSIKIEKIYYKSGDSTYSNWDKTKYKNIIKKSVEKSIPIYGAYLPSETLDINDVEKFKEILAKYQDCVVGTDVINNDSEFINFLFENKEKIINNNLLNKMNELNTNIKFGCSNVQLYNWEVFDEEGNVWTKESDKNREVVKDDNNNSIVALLTQGNKRALFTGDMNNLDENAETGRIGDETRLKDVIGDIDFIKLGHHGYQNSNTIDYLNTIKPEYAIITNDEGKMYSKTKEWLDNNNVEYFYSTDDLKEENYEEIIDSRSMIMKMENNSVALYHESLNEMSPDVFEEETENDEEKESKVDNEKQEEQGKNDKIDDEKNKEVDDKKIDEKDKSTANKNIPQTGVKINVILIIALFVLILYCIVKIYKNRDIK